MRSITLGAALRISPLLGMTALMSLTGCAKTDPGSMLVTVKSGLDYTAAAKEVLSSADFCGIKDPTDAQVKAAAEALTKANPSAQNPDEALSSTREWLYGIKGNIEGLYAPKTLCAGIGGGKVEAAPTVCPPVITALAGIELEQGGSVKVDLTGKLTLKNAGDKVFVTLADANQGVSVDSSTISISGANLSFTVAAKYNAKAQKQIVDIHDGDSIYSMEVTVKEKQRGGRGTTPQPTGTGTGNPPQPTGIPAAPPKREIPE